MTKKFIEGQLGQFDDDGNLLCPKCGQRMFNSFGGQDEDGYMEMWKCKCDVAIWEDCNFGEDPTFFQVRP